MAMGNRGKGRGKKTAPGYSGNTSVIGKKRSGQAPGTAGPINPSSSSSGGKASSGPSWKPTKASVTGNYGKAVSAAAKAKGSPAAAATSVSPAKPFKQKIGRPLTTSMKRKA